MKRQSVKHNNRKLIIGFLRKQEEVSIAQIAKAVRVSVPTVKKVLDHYMQIGLVILSGKGDSTLEGGKRPDLYRLNGSYGYVIALHVGPDFLYAAITDLKLHTIQTIHEPVVGSPSVDSVIDRLVEIAQSFQDSNWAQDKTLVDVVIALPGIVNAYTGDSVYSPHYPQWPNDYPFLRKFAEQFDRDIPIYMDGVNRLQAVAEMMIGQAQGKRNFLIVDAMEEGVGAGIMVEGSNIHGFNQLSGEIGHVIVDRQGPDCICGGKGCFEAAVSLKHIGKMVTEGFNSHSGSALYEKKLPNEVMLSDIFIHAANDIFARNLLDRIATYFAIGLNNVLMIVDPELIIIQGIYVDAGDGFIKMIREKLGELSLPRVRRNLSIVYTEFGLERGLLGASCFGVAQYFEEAELYK
jgi:predicted NBD/HSP70 family sugar kinase